MSTTSITSDLAARVWDDEIATRTARVSAALHALRHPDADESTPLREARKAELATQEAMLCGLLDAAPTTTSRTRIAEARRALAGMVQEDLVTVEPVRAETVVGGSVGSDQDARETEKAVGCLVNAYNLNLRILTRLLERYTRIAAAATPAGYADGLRNATETALSGLVADIAHTPARDLIDEESLAAAQKALGVLTADGAAENAPTA